MKKSEIARNLRCEWHPPFFKKGEKKRKNARFRAIWGKETRVLCVQTAPLPTTSKGKIEPRGLESWSEIE